MCLNEFLQTIIGDYNSDCARYVDGRRTIHRYSNRAIPYNGKAIGDDSHDFAAMIDGSDGSVEASKYFEEEAGEQMVRA